MSIWSNRLSINKFFWLNQRISLDYLKLWIGYLRRPRKICDSKVLNCIWNTETLAKLSVGQDWLVCTLAAQIDAEQWNLCTQNLCTPLSFCDQPAFGTFVLATLRTRWLLWCMKCYLVLSLLAWASALFVRKQSNTSPFCDPKILINLLFSIQLASYSCSWSSSTRWSYAFTFSVLNNLTKYHYFINFTVKSYLKLSHVPESVYQDSDNSNPIMSS